MRRTAVVVVLCGVAASVAVALVVQDAVNSAERQLVVQRAREAALVLSGEVGQIQLPLVAAGAALRVSGGNPDAFRQQMTPFIGAEGSFRAAALLQVESLAVLAELGDGIRLLDDGGPEAREALRRIGRRGGMGAVGLVGAGDDRRLGVAAGPPAPTGRVIYVEVSLPDRPGEALEDEEAFGDVDAALYLDHEQRPDELLLSTTRDLPIAGSPVTEAVPFGNDSMVLVIAPRDRLVGDLAGALPWVLLGAGLLGTAVVVTLLHRRDEAVRHAAETRRHSAELASAHAELARFNTDLERQVERRTAELRSSNRELEAFAYSVSHDLRTPLRAIDGFSSVLLEDYGRVLDEGGRRYLTRVRSATQRMSELIDDLLALSRVTRQSMTLERVDLSSEARRILDQLRQAEPARRVEAEVADGIVVEGDRRLLRVALENLVGNAWKFTRDRNPACIRFGVERADGEVACVVSDNGAGFDPAYVDKLFRPFQRLHRASEFEGSGIGLATVARVVERHGGRVWAEGAVGEGAHVRFVVPGTTGTAEQFGDGTEGES